MKDNFKFIEKVGAFGKYIRSAENDFSQHSRIEVIVKSVEGNVKGYSISHNIRTNAGANFWNTQLLSGAGAAAGANYIALTTDTAAPLVTDTTLASEENNTYGLGRAITSVTHSTNAITTQLSKTWTYTGSATKVIAKVGLFNAGSGPTLILESLLTSTVTVNTNGDEITINWVVNY